jgi:hypothetical protein
MSHQELLLVFAVIGVGVLHTMVPDHWAPIVLMARQQGWSRAQTARVAFGAGLGHTISTLAIGSVVWIAGIAVALRFGHLLSLLSSVALIGFGAWIALGAMRELRSPAPQVQPERDIKPGSRMALLLILGSSPMIEGVPAFFAAARFGPRLIVVMSICLAIATIATYVATSALSGSALQRLRLGPLERYGEVLSGALVAAVGIVFLIWPIA